ncbi:hypothetical protein LSTR_LSTR000899 [Laodelphax striatellus]|uniref:Uncharacterized protein n=1 Tax=Laodelphax striatellus TaxID=195883 RepID=A0A482X0U0_LAOST|nr:hypothetical protein LSTR_LSTR000899 [Laodelphax striatellus]
MPQSMMEVESDPQQKRQERSKKKHRKWTFGGLFRRKKAKESTSESSDSDDAHNQKKGGFLARRQRRRAANRGSKDVTGSFEHVVMRPSGGSSGNLSEGKRSLKARVEANRDKLRNESSSEEDSPHLARSHRSSKRLSKDMTDCSAIKVLDLDSSPRSPRWTAKIVYCESSDYEARYTARTRSATPSPAQSPVTKRAATAKQQLANSRPPKPQPAAVAPRPFIDQKSASFDLLPRPSRHNPRVPPPPPPRDPQRKIIPPLGYTTSFDRPLSYAFESDQPLPKLMMDHNSNITPYKVHSSSSLENRRPYQYYTDQQPRSRRPIHITRTDQHSYLSDSQIGRTRSHYGSADWRIPRGSNSSLYDSSDSREGPEPRQLSMVLESQEQVQNRLPQSFNQHQPIRDEYRFKDKQHNSNQNGELNRTQQHKYQDNHQQYWDNHQQYKDNHQQYKDNHQQYQENNQHSQKNYGNKSKSVNPHRKSNNLEDALDELEAIYKSLQMNDEDPPNSRGFESDTGCYRYIDDMAYRRLNRRDSNGSPDCRVIASQAGSYLLVSPALSPPPFANAPPIIPTPDNEPDITLDDVVYRSLKHANNTLKICDPQPPFGIPLGPVAPAANSDYLHASPKELYRSSFKPRKTPDVVKDDLAYRNLRKDKNSESLLSTEECVTNETSIKKKRAARSLSANLLSIIQKENSVLEDKRNSYNEQSNMEKTRSFSDLPDILNCRYKVNRFYTDDSDETPRASRQFQELPLSTTSTETLTDSRTEVIATNDYCSGRGRPVSLQNNKPLPKTDSTKNRLPSPSHRTSSPARNRSSSSTSPHRISPQRIPSPLPNRTYSTEGKIKYSSPTSVNLEKYMQRYTDNSIYQNNSPPTKIKQNGGEQMNSDKLRSGNHRELTVNSNRDDSVINCQKRPSPVSSPHHEYYRKHSSKQHGTTGEQTSPSVISVNTNKYLRDTQQTRSDTSVNNQFHSNSEEVPYHSSPLIYVRIPEKNKPAVTRDNPGTSGTPLSPTKSNVHNIVGNFNRLISDNSPSNSHLKTVEDNQSHSNSNKLGALTQPIEPSTENKSYTQVYHSPPKNSESSKDNYHSLLLKQFENNFDKNKSSKNEVSNRSGGALKNEREQSNKVYHSSCSKTNETLNTPKGGIGSNDKRTNQFQNDKLATKNLFDSYPTANKSLMSSKQEIKPGSSHKSQLDVRNKDGFHLRSSHFVPTSSHMSTESVTSFRAQQPQDDTAESYRTQVNSIKEFNNDFKNSKSLPEIRNSNEIGNVKISSTENNSCKFDDNRKFSHTKFYKDQNYVDNHFVKSSINTLQVNNFEGEPEVSPDENEHEVLSGNIAIKVLCSNPKLANPSSQNSNNTEVQKSIQQTQMKPREHKSDIENIVNTHTIPAPMKLPSHNYNSESITSQLTTLQAHQSYKDCKVDSGRKSNENSSKKSGYGQAEMESSKSEVECQRRNTSNSAQPNGSTSEELSTRTASQSLLEKVQQQTNKQSLITKEEAKEDEILNDDLNKLLSEINSKQEKLLNEASLISERPQEQDRKDSVTIGKIIQHKPVKLNTFLIDKELVNKDETEGDDVVRSSESMTDLLQELTRSLDQDFGKEKQVQANNSSDEALTDFDIASSISQDILQSVAAETISVVSDLSDSRDCSEICEILQDAAGKFGEGSFERSEPHNEQNNYDTSQASNTTELCEVDRVDCPSDTDSNAEFVEQIRKTASELSDLSSTTNNQTAISNQFPVAADRMRSSRAPAQADHSEGIVSSSSCSSRSCMLKPLVNSSGLLMLTTHCMADLHQMVDVDFLTMLGLLIAILSLFWLLIS